MRNLKKILALVLALVMSLSLMATAGAASFQDVTDDNPYKTAIDVLDQLKVFQGFEDGSFKPTSNLNRAQAAVLVYRIATGDVEGKYVDNYTYMAQSKFNDLDGYNWAKGYINYCQNAKIVVGTSATTFNPEKEVTGYQLMVMVLRTLGYGAAGEFTDPTKWELETAKIAEREGILKNVTGGDFGAPAPRQMVAEILFRGLLTETVTYSALTSGGYTKTGETLGERELGLEEVTGIVMANEYADLESSSTLDEKETRFVSLDGEDSYTVTNQTTTLDDIGESRLVYIQNGKTLLWMGDSGLNGIGDTDMYAKDLKELKTTANATGDGDHFINFDRVGDRVSDYKIKYVLLADTNGLFGGLSAAQVVDRINGAADDSRATTDAKKEKVTVVINPKKNITNVDLSYIAAIFGKADKVEAGTPDTYDIDGEVYVGSQSVVDISDVTNDNFKYSYDRFVDEFIYTKDGTFVTGNENGNYVKVIDNDGDGAVDYVLKTVYTFAQVSRVKDDKATLDVTNHALTVTRDLSSGIEKTGTCGVKTDVMNNLTGKEPVVCADTLAKGDIVYYALIDGNAQAVKVEPLTATIEKVDHNTWVTKTTDGTEYPASGVHEHIEDEAYTSDKKELAGKVSYDLYLDRAGNLGVFVKSDNAGEFKLLTDAWYHRLKDSREYSVKAYNNESGEQDTIDITTNAGLFVDDEIDGNDWLRLKYFGGSNTGSTGVLNGDGGVVRTTVAAIAEDGTILPVENGSVTGRYKRSMIDLMIDVEGKQQVEVPTADAVKGTVYSTTNGADTAYNTEGDVGNIDKSDAKSWTYDVRALTSTDYYVVYPTAVNRNGVATSVEVIHTVGYDNAPDLDDLKVEDIYAVGTYRTAENDKGEQNYFIANIVVVELEEAPAGTGELVLVVDDTARYSDARFRDVQIINSKGEVENVKVDWTGSYSNTLSYDEGKDNGKQILPGFYYLHGDKEDVCYLSNDESKVGTAANRIPLSAVQLRETGKVATAQMEKAYWTASEKYFLAYNWYKTLDANQQYTHPDESSKTSYYTMGEDTPLYTLTYNYNGYPDSNPELEKVEPDTTDEGVLGARVDVTFDRTLSRDYQNAREVDQNKADYNYNDLLIVHSKQAVTYVVSLNNIYEEAARVENNPSRYTKDYAQALWKNVMPAGAKADSLYAVPTVEFYGENTDNDMSDAADEIRVSYKTAFDAEEQAIVVTPGVDQYDNKNAITSVIVTDKNGVKLKAEKDDDGVWTCPVTPDKAGAEYSVQVIYNSAKDTPAVATWTLKQNEQIKTFGDLIIKAGKEAAAKKAGITITNPSVDAAAINVTVASGTKITTLGEVLGIENDTDAKIVLEVHDSSGTVDMDGLNDNVSSVIGTGATLWATITNGDYYEKPVQITVTGTTPAPAEPEVTPDGKEATVTPKADEILTTLTDTENTDKDYPVDATTEGGNTEVTRASFDKDAIDVLKDHAETVTVTGDSAEVKVPMEAIEEAIGDADPTTVEIVVAEGEAPDDVTLPTGSVVADVTIEVDGVEKSIEGLSKKITITLDAPAGTNNGDVVNVWVVTSDGLEQVPAADVEPVADGKVTFRVDHLTQFAIVKNLNLTGANVEAYGSATNTITVTGSAEAKNVAVTPATTLQYSPRQEAGNGSTLRKAGWWVGLKITAPTAYVAAEAKYRNNSDARDKLFDTYKDGNGFITVWGAVFEEDVIAGTVKDQYTYTWYFNWDGDDSTGTTQTVKGTEMKGVDQIITMTFSTADLTLMNGENQVWPEVPAEDPPATPPVTEEE